MELLPFDELAEAGAVRLAPHDSRTLQYGDERGALGLREEISGYVERRGAPGAVAGPDGLVVTSGVSQALDLLCTLLTKPGDIVLVEEPTYHFARLVFRDHQLRVVAVAGDEGGMLPDAFEEALDRYPDARLTYLVPSFGNPTGASVSEERARHILEVAERRGVWVLADEVYRLLNFGGAPQRSFAAYGVSRAVSLNSFSKILAPGLRLGWLVADPGLLTRFENSGLLQSGGGLNPLVGSLVEHVLSSGSADAHLAKLRTVYTRRATVLGAAIRQQLPDAEFLSPNGGYFIWLRVPGVGSTSGDLLRHAREGGVGYTPGVQFSPSGAQEDRLRLSFAYYDPPHLEEAVARLAAAVQSTAAAD